MLPVSEFLQRLESEGAAPKTVASYRAHLEKFASHCPKSLDTISAEDVYRFRDALDAAPRTKYNHVRAVKHFLRLHGVNLVVKLPRFTPSAPDEYNQDQIKQLFSVATKAESRLFMFYLCTGCREGEVQHAVWSNLVDDTYTVRPVGDWNPKKHKTRTITIPDSLSALLEPVRGTGLMFPNRDDKPDGHHLIKLQRLAKRSGLDPTLFCLQRFRRTFATTLLRSGATVHEVAGFLGHGNLNTIMRYLALANARSPRAKGLANSAFGF